MSIEDTFRLGPSSVKTQEWLTFVIIFGSNYRGSELGTVKKRGGSSVTHLLHKQALLAIETRYPDMEKLALALITAFQKLRPYFQAHAIEVLTNFPLKQVPQKPDTSGDY